MSTTNPTNYINMLQRFIQHLSHHFIISNTCARKHTHTKPSTHNCMHTGKAFGVQRRKWQLARNSLIQNWQD